MGKVLNINDIARLAGVSRSTVSRVLTNNKNVRKETALRVRAAIEEAGYRPNILARGLATGRLNLVGLLLPGTGHPYYTEIQNHLDAHIRDRGSMLSVFSLEGTAAERCAVFRTLQQYGFSGLVVGGVPSEPEFIGELDASGTPIVLIDRSAETLPRFDAVAADNYHGGYMAGKYLTDSGHRIAAVLTGPLALCVSRDRYRGFADALGESGIRLHPRRIREGDLSPESGAAFAREVLGGAAERCTAVFAAGDGMALGVLAYCMEAGIRVPEEVSIIGFGDAAASGAAAFGLTTVRQPYAELAALAAERITARIAGDTGPARAETLLPSLVIRRTTSRT